MRMGLLSFLVLVVSCQPRGDDESNNAKSREKEAHDVSYTIEWVNGSESTALTIEQSRKMEKFLDASEKVGGAILMDDEFGQSITSISVERVAPICCVLTTGYKLSSSTSFEFIHGMISQDGMLCTLGGRPRMTPKNREEFLLFLHEVTGGSKF